MGVSVLQDILYFGEFLGNLVLFWTCFELLTNGGLLSRYRTFWQRGRYWLLTFGKLFWTITQLQLFTQSPFFLSYRHFLFKTGTGTTPFFGAAAPGYTMATGTVYSTPARPLPRNSLSRGAFKFKKSPKHCSWKCTALIAVGIAVVLSIILCYCIGKPMFRLAIW